MKGCLIALLPFISFISSVWALPQGAYVQLTYTQLAAGGPVVGKIFVDLLEYSDAVPGSGRVSEYNWVGTHEIPALKIVHSALIGADTQSPYGWWINEKGQLIGALFDGSGQTKPFFALDSRERAYAMAEYDVDTLLVVAGDNRLLFIDPAEPLPARVLSRPVVDPVVFGQIIDIEVVSPSEFVAITDKNFLLRIDTNGSFNVPGTTQYARLLTSIRAFIPSHGVVYVGQVARLLQVAASGAAVWVTVEPVLPIAVNGNPSRVVTLGYDYSGTGAKSVLVHGSGSPVLNEVETLGVANMKNGTTLFYREKNEYHAAMLGGGTQSLSRIVFDVQQNTLHPAAPATVQIFVDYPKTAHNLVKRSQVPMHGNSSRILRPGVKGVRNGSPTSVSSDVLSDSGSKKESLPSVDTVPPNTSNPTKKKDFLALFAKESSLLRPGLTVAQFVSAVEFTYGPKYALDSLSSEECRALGFERIGRDKYRALDANQKIDIEKLAEALERANAQSCNAVANA